MDNLDSILKQHNISSVYIARTLGVSESVVYQWRHGLKPVPVKWCAALERATMGVVLREYLYPDDWALIWPELTGRIRAIKNSQNRGLECK